MKKSICSLATLILLVFLLSCDKEPLNVDCPSLPTSFVPTPNQALFLDVAFNQEFGQSTNRLRKWDQPIRFWFSGNPSNYARNEVELVVLQLSLLSTAISIEAALNEKEANLMLFFGPKEDYVGLIEPAAAGFAEGNSGFAAIAWNEQHQIIRASACFDIDESIDEDLQKHIIREEIAQTLGLINDTELDTASIFHQTISSTTAYSERDEEMIQYMLGNELEPGRCSFEVMEIVQ